MAQKIIRTTEEMMRWQYYAALLALLIAVIAAVGAVYFAYQVIAASRATVIGW